MLGDVAEGELDVAPDRRGLVVGVLDDPRQSSVLDKEGSSALVTCNGMNRGGAA